MLPESAAKGLSLLFDEYINQESLESKIVKSADKLMPLIQNLCTNERHSSYRKLNVEYREVLEPVKKLFVTSKHFSN